VTPVELDLAELRYVLLALDVLMSRAASLLLLMVLSACDAPRDPEGSTNRIMSSHVLRVGASEHRPWIWFEQGSPRGPEADLISGFAASQGARTMWQRGSENQLLPQLKEHRLDIVVGGFTTATPWSSKVGMSQPIVPHKLWESGHVLLTSPGENQLLLRLDKFLLARGHA
jgi:polar amino acid transport system substrate-binding protein